MKKIFLSVILTIPVILIYAQDLNINHYSFYKDGLNPGSFIHAPEVNLFLLYNNEFWGFVEEPKTQILDVSVNLSGNKLGVMVYNDIIGWDKSQNIKLRYAREFEINEKSSFSLGLAAGVIHKRLEATKMDFELDGIDPVSFYDQTHTVGDFDFGAEFRFENLVIGLSTNHLGKPLTKFDDFAPTPHYYGYGQYTTSGKPVQFRPSVLMRYWKSTFWAEAGALAFFNNLFWFGATYTTDHDLNCMAGLKIMKNKNFHFGYAFKSNMNAAILRPGSTNSHEIFLNISFGNGSSQFPLTVRNL